MKAFLSVILFSISSVVFSAEDLNTDVKVGVEAYILGELELSKYLLTNALTQYNKDNKKSEFNRSRVLNRANEQAAIEHLFPVFFELRDFEALANHLKKYGTNKKSSTIAHYKNVRRGDLWTCRTLDFQQQFIKASECWDKAGYEYERNVSMRAGAAKRIFSGRERIRGE